ncbi:hypothetical protein DIPPA_08418 [Diplonema papillatum]|nr:hypothetical protein DIPPA_08418 [Diplonema papillatum]
MHSVHLKSGEDLSKELRRGRSSSLEAIEVLRIEAEGPLILSGVIEWGKVRAIELKAPSILFGTHVDLLRSLEVLHITAGELVLGAQKLAFPALHTLVLKGVQVVMRPCSLRGISCRHGHLVTPVLASLTLTDLSYPAQEELRYVFEQSAEDALSALVEPAERTHDLVNTLRPLPKTPSNSANKLASVREFPPLSFSAHQQSHTDQRTEVEA